MSDVPKNDEDNEDDVVSALSPRNEHDGKIVTGSHPSKNTIDDDASDLTDHHVDNEDSTPKSFPQKLMNILGNEEYTPIIAWLPSGSGFQIHKKKAFASEILPRHFKATQFTSFTRKLNRWGFSRAPRGPDCGAYFHKLFHRDHPELCLGMSSSTVLTKARSVLAQDTTHQQPNMPVSPFPGMQTMPGAGMPYFMPPPNMMMHMNPMLQQQAMWHAQHVQQLQLMAFYQQAAAAAAGVLPQSPMMPNMMPMMMGQWQPPTPQQQQLQLQQLHQLTVQNNSASPSNPPTPNGGAMSLLQDEVKGDIPDDVESETGGGSSGSEHADGEQEVLDGAFGDVEREDV